MNLRTFLASIFILFPVFMFAHVTGTYHVSGFDPVTNQNYTGTLVITKAGAIYTANWTYSGGNTDTGTGVREDDSIAFVFNEEGTTNYGVQLYEIHCDTLKGPWVRYQAETKGFESAVKVSN